MIYIYVGETSLRFDSYIQPSTGLQQKSEIGNQRGFEQNPSSWNEFTQGTTFHGVKYIFESTSKLKR